MTSTSLHPLLAERSSPRAFDAGHALADHDLLALLEAARWAPSSMNRQPWRFVVARRGTAVHAKVVDTLMPGNQAWAHTASALVVAIAVRSHEGRPIGTADYDLGLAVMQMTVQAHAAGLHVHQMGGFDHEAMAALLDLPATFAPVVVVAVGRRDTPDRLPDALRAREVAPRLRRPLHETLLAVDDTPGHTWLQPTQGPQAERTGTAAPVA